MIKIKSKWTRFMEDHKTILDVEANLCVKVVFISEHRITVRPHGLKMAHLDMESIKESVKSFAGDREVVLV